MSEAAEAAVESPADEGFLSEDDFAHVAQQRMAEVFSIGQDTAADEETPAPEAEAQAEVETPPADEVVIGDDGRARGPDGKFVAVPKDDDEPDEETVDTSAAEAKYQTPEEAFKAAAEAQQLLGRQAQELGQLRAEMAALKAGVEQRLTVSTDDLEAMIENGEAEKAARTAAQQGDPDMMEQALLAWASEGPEESFQASTLRNQIYNDWRDHQRQREAAAQQEQAPPVPLTENAPLKAVITEYAADIKAHMPGIEQVLTEIPTLKQALQHGNEHQQADALRGAYLIAKSRHIDDTSSAAVTEATARAAEEAQQARADAAVVSASQGSASSATQPTFADDTKREFVEAARHMGFMQSDVA